jgi:hypothetical protein
MPDNLPYAHLPEDFARRVLGAVKLERTRRDGVRRRLVGVGLVGVLAAALVLPSLPSEADRDWRPRPLSDREEVAWLSGAMDGNADTLSYLMPEAAADTDDSE